MYIDDISPGEVIILDYRLFANTPVKVSAEGASAYNMYNQAQTTQTVPETLIVNT